MKFTHVALLLATSGLLHAAGDAAKRLDDAADMLTEIMSAPDKGIPQDLLSKAECVVLVPGLKKGAFIVGAKYGKGFMLCRKASSVGWSAPAAIRVEGGSVGFQIGGSETDVVAGEQQDGREETDAKQIYAGRGCNAAGGPVGRILRRKPMRKCTPKFSAYSRSRGAFAGVSLEGATLRPDDDWNNELYGKPLTNQRNRNGRHAFSRGGDETRQGAQ